MKSCLNCVHYRMCGWRGEPYQGSYSGGFPAKNYKEYKIKWNELHGKLCTEYKAIKGR